MDIFKEANLAGIKLRNRIIRSATHERIAVPNEELKNLYLQLAKGGVGAIITGYVAVDRFSLATPKMPAFWRNEDDKGWRNLLLEIKAYKTPVILQLGHGGGKSIPSIIGKNPLAPSRHEYLKGQYSDEMNDQDIRDLIQSFATCIENARNLGFDGVQIQASHGYLLSEFLSPRLNQRTDIWGGSTENRFRVIKEIYQEARKRVGNYPVLIKISAYDSDKGGMTVDESIKIAKLLQQVSCDAIEVSCGNENFFEIVRPSKVPVEAMLTSSPDFKSLSPEQKTLATREIATKFTIPSPLEDYNIPASIAIRSAVNIPVIAVGGIRKLGTIRDIIENGKANFVALSRPFIIEPDIVNKMRTGLQEQSRCINCTYCLTARSDKLKCFYGKIPN
jgi:2,4-dienoyl-CoA reductase-like NADH-dependent reductase (Old Yellow Enzyme family)